MDFFKEKKNQTSTKLKTPHQSSYLSIFFKKNTVFIVNKIHIHILALNISLGMPSSSMEYQKASTLFHTHHP